MSNQDPRHDEAAEAPVQRPKPGTPEHQEWVRAKARENWRKRAERIAADPEAKDRERLRKKARNYEARQRRRVGILPLPIGQRVPKEQ
ncbi:hypothetical protein [Rhodococcus sp. UFZ-B548]|uniref:hypothetical protein n=1 Tax=Rhodococcus sp. UFZ-B548 TaxID=2742212 RepID=UPI0015F710D5|nr:hypothetical protein [Rhodococcus sp. UFZ-B548]